MYRRDLLSKTAGAVATTGLLTGLASARQDGDPPNGNVDTTIVGWGDNRLVPTGNWITHQTGWIDQEGGESTKADVERWRDIVEIETYIDGDRVPEPEQYWGDIHYSPERDGWIVWWHYTTPPKKPGEHTVKFVLEYPEPFTDGDFTVEPGRYPLSGTYRVVPGNEQGQGKGQGHGNERGRGKGSNPGRGNGPK